MKALFFHHSTGANLLSEGKVRELLKKRNSKIELWDHGYNLSPFPQLTSKIIPYRTGLSNSEGKMIGIDYNVQIANNSPEGYLAVFSEDNPHLNEILNFNIIIFKTCYPTTKITSDEQLEQFKEIYRKLKLFFINHPDKLFIAFTPPPLRAELTRLDYSSRARKYAEWLKNEFPKESKNIQIFDFLNLLADDKNVLKKEYCRFIPWDSHPNKKANKEVASNLVEFICNQL